MTGRQSRLDGSGISAPGLFALHRQRPGISFNTVQTAFVLAALPARRDAAILDAGCGDGRTCAILRHVGYRHLDAIDLHPSLDVEGVRYRQASLEELPFEDGRFDAAVCLSVIYFLQRPDRGVRELARVLKTGGVLVMTGHTRHSLPTLARVICRALGCASARHLRDVVFHPVEYYLREVRSAGLEPVWVDGFHHLRLWYPGGVVLNHVVQRLLEHRFIHTRGPWTKNRFWRWVDARVGYHFVVIARKSDAVRRS